MGGWDRGVGLRGGGWRGRMLGMGGGGMGRIVLWGLGGLVGVDMLRVVLLEERERGGARWIVGNWRLG